MDAEREEQVAREAEALEIRLREILDADEATSAVQIVLARGWRPPEDS